jgi:6-phosphogluconolactonase
MNERFRNEQIQVFNDVDALSRAAADLVVETVSGVVQARGRCNLVLAGGSTPLRLYKLLAGPEAVRIPWEKVHLFWGDERYVSHDHPDSNYGAAYEAMIRHIPIPSGNIHPVPTEDPDPVQAAASYERLLRQYATAEAVFDLVLLGLGEDGHTASIFPGPDLVDQLKRDSDDDIWVRAVQGPASRPPRRRITMTLHAIAQARRVFFLVSGTAKYPALSAILNQSPESETFPAAHVRTREQIIWFIGAGAYAGRG